MNGIINIITKHTDDTRGGLAYAGIGAEERVAGGARYGGALGKETGFRVFAKYFDRDETRDWNEVEKSDKWDMFRAGFRTDVRLSDGDEVTCQGDVYDGEIKELSAFPVTEFPFFKIFEDANRVFGGNAIGRWRHTYRDGSAVDLQIYYERTDREESGSAVIGDIVDADFQHRFSFGVQDIVWGLGYRYHQDEVRPSETVEFIPSSREYQLCSAFFQDDVAFFKDQLRLTLGAKIEHNDFSGIELQPGGRLLWTPSQSHVFWGAVARAVGTPSRMYQDVKFRRYVYPPETTENPSPYPVSLNAVGNPDVVSEKLTAFELGHRLQLSHHFSLDSAIFYNIYKDLLTMSEETPYLVETSGSPYVVAPIRVSNLMEGETWGLELAANWKPFTWWRLSPAYTYLHVDLIPEEGSSLYYSLVLEKTSPKRQFSVRSFADLPGNLEFDVWLRYVDSISDGEVGDYTALDARLGWQPVRNLELSISGKNLLDSGHPEFIEQFIWGQSSEIERSVFGKATWRF